MVTTVLSQPILAVAAELPSGGNIVAGHATIGAAGNGLLIEQGSQNAIIQWDGFSVGSNRTVNFQNGAGATLNRVTGADISRIDGNLSATGSLFLINQNGVVVGKDGVIETGGSFVGSTLDVSNQDFLNGGDMTFSGNSVASVINLGKVSSLGGDVALIARHVTNEGTILAPNGTAALVAGREVLMRDAALNDGKFSVRLGDANSSVTEAGMIAAAAVELRANGGNVYALAGNKGGSINATGVSSSGGRVFLTAAGGKVRVAKKVKATRNTGAGGDVFVNADIVSVANLLDVSSTTGQGGNIDIGARDTITLEGATLDASGTTGGGRIRVGGEFQGGKGLATDEVQNVQTLLIDQASTLIADGTGANADGGTIINWADDTTEFAGNISATGTLNGGFAEVSGKSVLEYSGRANLGGDLGENGTLLLDPANFTISAANIIAINTALNNGNLVISTLGAAGEDGDIFVNEAVIYDTGNAFTLLAHRNIEANASIQNEGAGDLNLIAGWDGTTGYAAPGATADIAAIITGPDAYGQNDGDVFIGEANLSTGIAVGSRFGTTTVLAEDLTLTGGSTSNAYAQLGFQATDEGAAYSITGDIDVHTTGNITAQGGSAYAQIGHVGADVSSDIVVDATVTSAAITIDAGGNLSFNGGSGPDAYAQLGHGGLLAYGNHSGAISITSSGDLSFNGGSGFNAYAQLGHGGYFADGSYSGDITITQAGNLSFTGGSGGSAYAQLGHGGHATDGDHSGDITITQADNLSFAGGSGPDAYAQLGHGGFAAYGDHSGAISITASGDSSFTGGGGGAYAQLGHGGSIAEGDHSGAISITQAGNLSFTGGSGGSAYAQLGHGDASGFTGGTRQGDISVIANGETSIADGTGFNAFGWIGHYSADTSAISNADVAVVTNGLTVSVDDFAGMLENDLEGGNVLIVNTLAQIADPDSSNPDLTDDIVFTGSDVDISTSHDLTLVATGEVTFENSYQNSGTGDINLVAGWDGTTGLDTTSFPTLDVAAIDTANAFGASSGSQGDNGDVNIGDGAQSSAIAVGSAGGLTLALGHDIEVIGSDTTDDAFAQLGFLTHSRSAESSIYVVAADDVKVWAGANDGAYAQIGHGGAGNTGHSATGNIDVTAGDEVSVLGWDGRVAYAQIGHGGSEFTDSTFGTVNVKADFVYVRSGKGRSAYAQIGHGGLRSSGGFNGDIIVDAPIIEIFGNSATNSYAQIGHGGLSGGGSSDGKITVTTSDVRVRGGDGTDAYAQIGHGGWAYGGNLSGDIDVSSTDLVRVAGSTGQRAHAQIGHGGASATGSRSGNIFVTATSQLNVAAGLGWDSYSQIGHGGSFSGDTTTPDVITGNIIVDLGGSGDLFVQGGAGLGAYAQIGHGGLQLLVPPGMIEVTASQIDIIAADFVGVGLGSGGEAYGQIGHGGLSSSGDLSGAINIDATMIEVFGGASADSYAQIGHGDAVGKSSGERQGDISITATSEISIVDDSEIAWVGHNTSTRDGVSNADLMMQAASFDQVALSPFPPTADVALGELGVISADIISEGMAGGDVTIIATGSGLSPDGAISYESDNQLIIQTGNNVVPVGNDIVLDSGETIRNDGSGDIILAAGGDFHNDTGEVSPISTNSPGLWLVYSHDPDDNRNVISSPDFTRYSTDYDVSDPIPAFVSGNGLIYEVDEGSTGTPTTPTTPTDTDDPTDTDEPTDTDDPTDSDDPTDPTGTPGTGGIPTDVNPFGPSTPRVLKFSFLPCEPSDGVGPATDTQPQTSTDGLCRTVLN